MTERRRRRRVGSVVTGACNAGESWCGEARPRSCRESARCEAADVVRRRALCASRPHNQSSRAWEVRRPQQSRFGGSAGGSAVQLEVGV